MDQLEKPATVEFDFQMLEVKKELNSSEQQANDTKKETNSTDKEFIGQVSSELNLKREITYELSCDVKPESSGKKKRKSSKDYIESTIVSQFKTYKEVIESAADTEEIYSLLVSNFPESWSFQQICNYVSQSLEGVSVEMEPIVGKNKNELRLTFNSPDHRLRAQNALQNKVVDGCQLHAIMEGPVHDDTDSAMTKESPSIIQDIWDVDPKGLYGLKVDYLKTLNIIPPIGNWVHVSNFRCDKFELRDVFELAGNVVACSVVHSKTKYAKVKYNHPLEAVQAVAMLNDQLFYGQKLSVSLDNTPNAENMLPKGLNGIGPGLGEDGKPVRQITREYERLLSGKPTNINLSLFTAGNVNGIVISQKKTDFTVIGGVEAANINTLPTTSSVVTKQTYTPAPIKPASPNILPALNRPPSPNIPPVRPNIAPNIQPGPHEPNHRFSSMFRGPMHRGPMSGPMGDICPPRQFHCGFPPGPGPMPFGPRPPPPPGPVRLPMHMVAPGPSPNWLNAQPVGHMPQMTKTMDATTLNICNNLKFDLEDSFELQG